MSDRRAEIDEATAVVRWLLAGFDFGDDWRVRLTVRERVTAEPGDHPRVLELRGTPPPQYAALDD